MRRSSRSVGSVGSAGGRRTTPLQAQYALRDSLRATRGPRCDRFGVVLVAAA